MSYLTETFHGESLKDWNRNQIPKCKFTPNLHNICKNGKFSKIDHISPNWTSTMAKTQGRVVWFFFRIKLDYYANNHIICIIYAKFENIELLPFSSEKLMYYIVQMFPRSSRNNISINKFDIYENTHLICIRYANIYNIKNNALFTH